MSRHLSASQIENYVARRITRTDFDRVSDHVYSCERCRQDLLTELQDRFPIEIDLQELAGIYDGHLKGDKLAAYVEKRMDDLDLERARLHLPNCLSCSDAVKSFSRSPEASATPRHSRARVTLWSPRSPGVYGVLDTRLRIAGIAAAIAIFAVVLWLVLQARPDEQIAEIPAENSPPEQIAPKQAVLPSPTPSVGNDDGPFKASPRQIMPLPKADMASGGSQNEAAVIGRNLEMPAVIERLDRTPALVVRGNPAAVESFSIVGPFATVIATDRPRFRWTPLDGAENFRVSIYDEALDLVRSGELVHESHWTVQKPLKPGVVYTWIVTALKEGREIVAPAPPARAEFQIMGQRELQKLKRTISETQSHADRGMLYAAAGLLDEAERELEIHLADNPADERVQLLLQRIKSWRSQ